MLHVQSDYFEFTKRFGEIWGDPDALADFYDRVKSRRDSLWNDYRKTGSEEIREEYDKFKKLTRKVRRRRMHTSMNRASTNGANIF